MAGPSDMAELVGLLESSDLTIMNEVKTLISENFTKVKEPWLVNALVDTFIVSHSQRCLEVLGSIQEPQDKQLLERLCDYMKGGQKLEGVQNQKLGALHIISHLIRREPVWIHKLVGHPLMSLVLRCLKTETDVLIQVMGSFVLTGLLPIVPFSIVNNLQDIFEIFSRLAAFCLNKSEDHFCHPPSSNVHYGRAHTVLLLIINKPGIGRNMLFETSSISDIYLLHLQVGTHCLFQRLYGMYPCLFITFLRNVYGKPENFAVFREVITPMSDQVRLHPLLVIGTKEKETTKDRWKEKEVHDIIVDCARLSLDMIETGAESNQNFMAVKGSKVTQSIASQELPSITFDKAKLDVGIVWSPTHSCDVSTPPLNASKVPGLPCTESFSNNLQSSMELEKSKAQTIVAAAIPSQTVDKNAGFEQITLPTPSHEGLSAGNDVELDLSDKSFGKEETTPIEVHPNQPPNVIASAANAPADNIPPPGASLTPAAMAAFMKQVKRIRFNSINVSSKERSSNTSLCPSSSCPHLSTLDAEDEPAWSSSMECLKDHSDKMLSSGSVASGSPPIEFTAHVTSPAVTTSTAESQTSYYVFFPDIDNVDKVDTEDVLVPFEFPLGYILPFAPFIQCYSCMRQAQCQRWPKMESGECAHIGTFPGSITPLYKTYSPLELLDRHVAKSLAVHENKLSNNAAASQSKSSSDVITLKAQIQLLHNQLMFERHRQELQAKRNRRLLGRIAKVVSLEEQNTAMRDQLRLQETEMNRLTDSNQSKQIVIQGLKTTIETLKHDALVQHKSNSSENDDLKLRLKTFEDDLRNEKQANQDLKMQLDKLKYDMFTQDRELELLRLKVSVCDQLKSQVNQLNTELLLMGELHQKYQQRLSSNNPTYSSGRQEMQMCSDSYKDECARLKSSADNAYAALRVENSKVQELETLLQAKDEIILQQKQMIEQLKTTQLEQLQNFKERYKIENRAHQSCQQMVLELQSELGLLKNHRPPRASSEAARSLHSSLSVEGVAADVSNTI